VILIILITQQVITSNIQMPYCCQFVVFNYQLFVNYQKTNRQKNPSPLTAVQMSGFGLYNRRCLLYQAMTLADVDENK